MTEAQISSILARSEIKTLSEMAEQVTREGGYAVLQPPASGMIMMQVTETVQHQLFLVGEVLFTECEVRVGDAVARGYALGEDPERALGSAIIRAALAGAGHPLLPRIRQFLEEQAGAIAAEKRFVDALVARTKVQFETLEDQDAEHKGSRL